MSEKKVELILQAYKNTQNMISFADTKANISLSVQSLLISIGLGASILADSFSIINKLDNYISAIFYVIVTCFIFTSIIGVTLSILTYKARPPEDRKEKDRDGLLYFGHISQYPNFEDYYSKITTIDDEKFLKEFAQQVYHLSHIAKKKMDYVNISICFLLVNLLLTISIIMISGYISIL